MSDLVSATSSYGGITTHESELDTADGFTDCQSYWLIDVYSTVDFGNLDDHGHPPLAKACWWYTASSGRDTTVQVDIRFDVHDYLWTNTPGDSICDAYKMYDLESASTHESGHAFGLWHVAENAHKWLTISTITQPCTPRHAHTGLRRQPRPACHLLKRERTDG